MPHGEEPGQCPTARQQPFISRLGRRDRGDLALMRTALAICAFVSLSATFASIVAGTYFFFRTSTQIAAGSPRRWIVKVNRFNAVLFPDELSPVGRQYRSRYLKAVAAALCSMAVFALTALALELTKPN